MKAQEAKTQREPGSEVLSSVERIMPENLGALKDILAGHKRHGGDGGYEPNAA